MSEQHSCKHYQICGGCSMRHLAEAEYYSIKEKIISEIAEKYSAEVLPLVQIGEGKRRRVDFKLSVNKGNIELGFFKHRSNDIVSLEECPVTDAQIVALIPAIKEMLLIFKKPGKISSVSVAKLEKGFDVYIKVKELSKSPDVNALEKFAKANNIKRIFEAGQGDDIRKLYDDGECQITIAGERINIPENCFLQATEAGQEAIIKFILDNIGASEDVADLYSGVGTYTIPLLKNGVRVSSYEGAEDMISSLLSNVRRLEFNTLRLAEVRDLFKNPVSARDINNFDTVVINPPRTGAIRQIKQIAKSELEKLIYISCDRKTFLNDFKILTDAGFKLKKIQGIDQFFMSKHIEIATLIER